MKRIDITHRAATAGLLLALGAAPVGLVARVHAEDGEDAKVAKAVERAKALEQAIVTVTEKTSAAFVVIGGGSGIVVTADGYMLTNHHVAGSKPVGQVWRVKIPGQGILDAKVVGHDSVGDITLLKLSGKDSFPHVELADSDEVKVGDFALALGNPFGYSKDSTPTVTTGVVSAVHRFQGGYSDAIQTDAPINPGNSGGPLLDSQGRLMGINGRIAVRHGTKINTGVGYAIPANQIKRFLEDFKTKGNVAHGFVSGLGRLSNTSEGDGGARVEGLTAGSTAEKAGLKRGDLIVEADGRTVGHVARLQGIIGTIPAGEEILLKVQRGTDLVEIKVKLESRAGEGSDGRAAAKTNGAYLGVQMSTQEGGVQIDAVSEGSPAETAGLKEGDLVSHFVSTTGTKHKVFNVNELISYLAKQKPGDKIGLAVTREGKKLEILVVLGKKSEGE